MVYRLYQLLLRGGRYKLVGGLLWYVSKHGQCQSMYDGILNKYVVKGNNADT